MVKCYHWPLPISLTLIFSPEIREPSSIPVFATVISRRQRTPIIGFDRDSGTLLTKAFLKALARGLSVLWGVQSGMGKGWLSRFYTIPKWDTRQ